MKILSALQDKIDQLIVLIKELKAENTKLNKSNAQLNKKLESMESSATNNENDLKGLSEEKARTKMVVEDLIKNIDSFVHGEKQS